MHPKGAGRADAGGDPGGSEYRASWSGQDDLILTDFAMNDAGDQTFRPAAETTARAPLAYLGVSAVSVLTALGLLVAAAHKPLASLIAWVLAGPVAIVCVGLFLGADTKRRSATVYLGKPWSKTAYTAIALAAVVIAAWAAWQFADWAARR